VVIFITSGSRGLVGGKRDGGEEMNRRYFNNKRGDIPSFFIFITSGSRGLVGGKRDGGDPYPHLPRAAG
jgi:hypothetical protein